MFPSFWLEIFTFIGEGLRSWASDDCSSLTWRFVCKSKVVCGKAPARLSGDEFHTRAPPLFSLSSPPASQNFPFCNRTDFARICLLALTLISVSQEEEEVVSGIPPDLRLVNYWLFWGGLQLDQAGREMCRLRTWYGFLIVLFSLSTVHSHELTELSRNQGKFFCGFAAWKLINRFWD